jgi:hypothetical protein
MLPNVSFECFTTMPERIMREISLAMDAVEAGVDHSVVGRTLAGRAYDGCGSRCKFSVKLTSMGARHVVEFQRTSGSALVFSSFCATIAENLAEVKSFFNVTLHTSATALAPEEPVEQQEDEDEDCEDGEVCALDESTCLTLLEMCGSEFVDVQLEAIKTVAALSTTQAEDIASWAGPELRQTLLAANLQDPFAASSLCANMCSVREFARESLLLLPVLFSWLGGYDMGTKRNAGRAIVLITEQLGDLMEICSQEDGAKYESIIQSLSSSDPALKEPIKKLENCVLIM